MLAIKSLETYSYNVISHSRITSTRPNSRSREYLRLDSVILTTLQPLRNECSFSSKLFFCFFILVQSDCRKIYFFIMTQDDYPPPYPHTHTHTHIFASCHLCCTKYLLLYHDATCHSKAARLEGFQDVRGRLVPKFTYRFRCFKTWRANASEALKGAFT